MRDTRDPGVIFAEFLNREMNGVAAPEPVAAEPTGPRAPRPDMSQGSSAWPTYLDRAGMSSQMFERAMHEAINRPLWTHL